MIEVNAPASELTSRSVRIAQEVAGPAAEDVDRSARFPTEAIDALREEGLMAALIPVEWGGGGASVGQVAQVTSTLGRHCASTAMIYAMHQSQVASLVRHGRSALLRDYLRQVAAEGLLLASATTEAGIGGDVRSSICAVNLDAGRFRVEKNAPVISYGQNADGILVTARRSPDSPASDQVLLLCRKGDFTLEQTTGWDTLGFRGTCSLGFRLTAEGDEQQILTDGYADISSHTMLPVAHVLWASVWLGLSTAAADRARRFVRSIARKNPGTTPPSALHLAELMALHQQMSDLVGSAANRFDRHADDTDALSSMGFAIGMNALKVSASTLVVDIVGRALSICGIEGYREDSDISLGRYLRDAYGAALMVSNDRINGNNAQMLLVHKDD